MWMRSTWRTVEKEQSSILRQEPNSKKLCLQNKLNLLDASVRHLGTDINYVVLQNLYNQMKDHMDFYFDTPVAQLKRLKMATKLYVKKAVMNVKNVLYL